MRDSKVRTNLKLVNQPQEIIVAVKTEGWRSDDGRLYTTRRLAIRADLEHFIKQGSLGHTSRSIEDVLLANPQAVIDILNQALSPEAK